MQGMSHVQQPAKKPAKPATTKKPLPKQTQPQKSAAHSMSGMDMSSMPSMTMPSQSMPDKQHAAHAGAMQGIKKTQAPKDTSPSMPGMDMSSMPGMDMPGTSMQPPPNLTGETQKLDIGSQIGVRPVVRGLNLETMQMDMEGMQMQGGKAPADARSADYSDGLGYGSLGGPVMAGTKPLAMLLIDRLEYFDGRDGNGVALDAQGWYGTDANKLWLKTEGETGAGRLQDLRFEALWAHPLRIYWNTQLGVRHDFGVGPGRTWGAFGVQGLAPYWFNIEATFYVGQAGRTAFRFESEYEILLTQRLILQPRFEINLYGRNDPQRGIGSGLSDATGGLRLRYEFTRKFAPYVGVEFDRKFGKTADLARAAGERAFDPRLVAGLHFWF